MSFDSINKISLFCGNLPRFPDRCLKGTRRTVESRSQELISTDEADYKAIVMLMLILFWLLWRIGEKLKSSNKCVIFDIKEVIDSTNYICRPE
jgi:hypothetical protein